MSIETDDYWIYQNCLIFKPYFNKELDNKLLLEHDKIIFANYASKCPDMNTSRQKIYSHLYCSSRFNHKAIFPNNIKYLSFGDNFNNFLILPNALLHLIFGFEFNYPIDLPQTITHLTFGCNFNQPIDLPQTIIHLTFGICFNQNVILPMGLKYLNLNCSNEYILDNLVDTIEELELNMFFDLKFNNLPNNIKKIIFNRDSRYDKDLNSLPDSVEFIRLPSTYTKKIKSVPKSLKCIECHHHYMFNNCYEKHINISKYKN
jgi:hypothetical protein